MFKILTSRKFEISFLLGFPLSSGTTRAVFVKSGKILCSVLELIDNHFVKFYFITYFYIFHDNRKNWFRSLYLLSAVNFGLQPLIWVTADKFGFRPLTGKKIETPLVSLLHSLLNTRLTCFISQYFRFLS